MSKLSVIGSRALLIGVGVLLLEACSGVPSIPRKSRTLDFDKAIKTYTKYIRWGYFDEAAGFVRTQDNSPIAIDLDRMARYRVSGYKVVAQYLADTSLEGRVVASIEYYEIDSGVLKTLRDEQSWWFDEQGKRWYLASPLPQFGKGKEVEREVFSTPESIS